MSIIEELWYGNVSLCDAEIRNGSAYAELLNYVCRHEDNLKNTLNDEEKIIFEKFAECTNEMYGIAEREAFIQGFSLGVGIIIEVLGADRV